MSQTHFCHLPKRNDVFCVAVKRVNEFFVVVVIRASAFFPGSIKLPFSKLNEPAITLGIIV